MASITKRIGKDGKVSYRVLIRKNGFAPVSETFARSSDAEKWARKTEHEMDRRVYVVDSKQPLKEIFEKYHDEVSPLKPGAKWEKVRIKKFIRDCKFIGLSVSQVSYRDIQAWRDQRLKEVSPASVRRELGLISSVFRHAMNEWHIAMVENPASRCRRPPKAKPRTRRISQTEIDALWDYFDRQISTSQTYIPWMFEFAIETGMRLGELCKLRWDQFNQKERWVYVATSKNGDDRYVPLSERAIALLVGVRMANAKKDLIFPVNVGSTGTLFRRACKELGIVDMHFHDTRHEACSRLAKIFTVLELAKIIGHRDLHSLMIYYNPTAAELAQKFGGATPPTPAHPTSPTAVSGQGASVSAARVPVNDSHIDEQYSATG